MFRTVPYMNLTERLNALRTLNPVLKDALLLAFMLLLLVFRNPRIFTWPEPWIEDMMIFIRDEYNTGFPDTAFAVYAGYIHLLPRIITWIAMKSDPENVMRVMSWSVLIIKLLAFFLIYKSKEISSAAVKFSLLAYLVLLPFCSEIYNNVTNLQWWLIPLMGVIIIKRETGISGLVVSVIMLILTGLTGVNSVLFALPCACLMLMVRTKYCTAKCLTVIACAGAQLYVLCASGRVSGGGTLSAVASYISETGGIDLIHLFVIRVIYHTLFSFGSEKYLTGPRSYADILVFLLFIYILVLNLRHCRRQPFVWFIFLFASVYTAAIFCQLIKSEGVSWHISSRFGGERYFVFLRICNFVLLVSSIDMLFRKVLGRDGYRKAMICLGILLSAVLLKNYPVFFKFEHQYYADVERFRSAEPGTPVTVHFPPDYFPAGRSIVLIKK